MYTYAFTCTHNIKIYIYMYVCIHACIWGKPKPRPTHSM